MRRREIDQSAGDHMAVIADETGDAPDDEQQSDAGYPQLHQLSYVTPAVLGNGLRRIDWREYRRPISGNSHPHPGV
ncbi:hypothetical protein MPRG_40240 [Mycobacterium paragordonae]|uniref:Uncharacterized protein n=1 Tax=Mycobacterium paragordonae TaxID=1389713 RepID=A0ABQ1C9L4_9MYCO|nr:hypothetical protein MPRG_40240 [Mycobacterium paragordonae]